MKYRRLIVASLTSLIASVPAASSLEACEQCRVKTCYSCDAAQDDRGLLDLLDAASHRMQPRLPRVTLQRVASLDSALRFALGGRSAATCGCEIVEATCGCELNAPTCGCELQSSCACQDHGYSGGFQGYEYDQPTLHHHQHGVNSTAPHTFAPQPEALPIPEAASRGRVRAPELTSPQRSNSHPPAALPQAQPQSQPQAPARIPVPVPTSVPDSQVDPFRDDTATRIRQIPSRTVEYRQAAPTYRQNYDPQANTSARARMRLSDDYTPTAERHGLAEHGSSRSRSSQDVGDTNRQNPPSVVTASGSSLRSYDRGHSKPTAIAPTNPLRPN